MRKQGVVLRSPTPPIWRLENADRKRLKGLRMKKALGEVFYEKDETGKARAILYRKGNGEKYETDPCPFCGLKHVHGDGDGHRAAHCYKPEKEATATDGTIVRESDGYIVRTKL